MPHSPSETILSPRSSLSSSPFSSVSSIDSPLISDSISDWAHRNSPGGDYTRPSNHRRPHHQNHIHSSVSSCDSHSSNSDSIPMTPWDLRPELALPETSDRRPGTSSGEDHFNLDMDHDRDENNVPPLYLGHTRWKQAQGNHTPGQTPAQQYKHLSGDRTNIQVPDRTVAHRKSRSKLKTRQGTSRHIYYEPNLSKDFFLILTLCFVLACFLICLSRPAIASWFTSPVSPLGFDEL